MRGAGGGERGVYSCCARRSCYTIGHASPIRRSFSRLGGGGEVKRCFVDKIFEQDRSREGPLCDIVPRGCPWMRPVFQQCHQEGVFLNAMRHETPVAEYLVRFSSFFSVLSIHITEGLSITRPKRYCKRMYKNVAIRVSAA